MKVCIACDDLKRALECVSLASGGSAGKGKKKDEDVTDAGGISISIMPAGKDLCLITFRKRGAFEFIEYLATGKSKAPAEADCVVDAKRFVALAKLFSGSVELSFGEKEITFIGENSCYKLMALANYEIEAPAFADTQLVISPVLLADMHRRCEFACNKDLNHVQSAMQLNLKSDGSAVCYGSHNHMVAQYVVPSTGVRADKSILVLPVSILHICELADSLDVNLAVDGKGLYAVTERYRYYAKPLAGNYPDCARIMQQPTERTLRVNKARLLEAISRATVVADDGSSFSRLNMRSQDNDLLLEAISEVGSAEEILALESIDGVMDKRSVNGNKLRSIVYAISGDEVVIQFGKPLAPLLISGTGGECHYVLASVR